MRAFGWFLAWSAVGGAYAMVLAGALTIGICFLPVAVIATILLARTRRSFPGLVGLIAGPGLLLVYIGYLNRGGPGLGCVTNGGGDQVCTQRYSPWPFLVIGLVLMLGSVALFSLIQHRTRVGSGTRIK
jgi:hypothetical protein